MHDFSIDADAAEAARVVICSLTRRFLDRKQSGYSETETAREIAAEHRITVPRRTLSDWIAGCRSITTFCRLRSSAVCQFSDQMLRERTLKHQQIY
jgi:hypothetical protein